MNRFIEWTTDSLITRSFAATYWRFNFIPQHFFYVYSKIFLQWKDGILGGIQIAMHLGRLVMIKEVNREGNLLHWKHVHRVRWPCQQQWDCCLPHNGRGTTCTVTCHTNYICHLWHWLDHDFVLFVGGLVAVFVWLYFIKWGWPEEHQETVKQAARHCCSAKYSSSYLTMWL